MIRPGTRFQPRGGSSVRGALALALALCGLAALGWLIRYGPNFSPTQAASPSGGLASPRDRIRDAPGNLIAHQQGPTVSRVRETLDPALSDRGQPDPKATPDTDPPEFTVLGPGPIEGRVLGPDGLPQDLFRVRLYRIDRKYRGRALQSLRGHAGRFLLEDVAPGRYEIEVGFGGILADAIGVEVLERPPVSATAPELLFRLRGYTAVRGRVVDGKGRAVEGASIFVFRLGWGNTRNTLSDPEGLFVFNQLMARRLVLIARMDGDGDSDPLLIDPRDEQTTGDVCLVLGSLARVTGTVRTQDGVPVAGATVHLTPKKSSDHPLLVGTSLVRSGKALSTKTDSDGCFAFSVQASAEYDLRARALDHAEHGAGDSEWTQPMALLDRFVSQTGSVVLGEAQQHQLVIPGAEAVTMEGRLSFNGQAARGEGLLLGSLQAGSNWEATDSTDAEGRFLFKLPNLNRVQLTLRHGVSSQGITISADETTGGRVALIRPYDPTLGRGLRTEVSFLPVRGNLDIDLPVGAIQGTLEVSTPVTIVLEPLRIPPLSGGIDASTSGSVVSSTDGFFALEPVIAGVYRIGIGKDPESVRHWTEVNVIAGQIAQNTWLAPRTASSTGR